MAPTLGVVRLLRRYFEMGSSRTVSCAPCPYCATGASQQTTRERCADEVAQCWDRVGDVTLRSAGCREVVILQRLAALVPRPRLHLIRFHGVLAPDVSFRRATNERQLGRNATVSSGSTAACREVGVAVLMQDEAIVDHRHRTLDRDSRELHPISSSPRKAADTALERAKCRLRTYFVAGAALGARVGAVSPFISSAVLWV